MALAGGSANSQRPQLTYLSWAMLPNHTANSLQTVKMCAAFAEAGAEVVLLHPAFSRNPYGSADGLWDYYQVARDAFARHELESLSFRLGLAPRLGESHGLRLTTSPLYRRWLTRHAGPGSLVYTRDRDDLGWLAALRRRLGFRLAFETHLPLDAGGGREAALCREIDLLVPITANLAAAYREAGVPDDLIAVEHDGFDAHEFEHLPGREEARAQLGVPRDAFVIGYVGCFDYMHGSKGVPELVEAAALLRADPRIRLNLVGGKPAEVESVRGRALALGLNPDQIDCCGRVGRAALLQRLASFDVCAHALPDNEANRGQSPLKIFEYMAAGRPIVTTALAGMREVLSDGESALLVAPGDVGALRDGLQRLRDDPALGVRLAARAQAEVQRYTWLARARRILDRLTSAA